MKTQERIEHAMRNLEKHAVAQELIGNKTAATQVMCTLGAIQWVLDLPEGDGFELFIMAGTEEVEKRNAN